MKKKLLLVLSLIGVVLAACDSDPLQNGENWACSDGIGYIDMLTDMNDPVRQARFSCTYPEFDVVFSLPMNACLFNAIREYSGNQYLGIILRSDGEIIQFYQNYQVPPVQGIFNLWDVDSDC